MAEHFDGFFVAPDGDGPFPGVVFHHGSAGLMAEAKIGLLELVGMGYAVFAPIRRGHNGNPGPFWETLVTEPWGSAAMGPQLGLGLGRRVRRHARRARMDQGSSHRRSRASCDAAVCVVVRRRDGDVGSLVAAPISALGISFAGPSITWPDAPRIAGPC